MFLNMIINTSVKCVRRYQCSLSQQCSCTVHDMVMWTIYCKCNVLSKYCDVYGSKYQWWTNCRWWVGSWITSEWLLQLRATWSCTDLARCVAHCSRCFWHSDSVCHSLNLCVYVTLICDVKSQSFQIRNLHCGVVARNDQLFIIVRMCALHTPVCNLGRGSM